MVTNVGSVRRAACGVRLAACPVSTIRAQGQGTLRPLQVIWLV